MTPPSILICNATLVTQSPGTPHNAPLVERTLRVTHDACLHIENGRIASLLSTSDATTTIDAGGRVVMPGFVDCHTHACFTGSRLDEWEKRLAGATYLDLLNSGGGIMSTVRAVRAAATESLAEELAARLSSALRHGTTSMEIKSGYGLDAENERKMLDAITTVAKTSPMTVTPTALLGHALDADRAGTSEDYFDHVIAEILPAISSAYPGITIDAYCESGAWTPEDCKRLFDAAHAAGHPCRVHADQFNDLNFIEHAVKHAFRSVDHLEASSPDHLKLLAASNTFGVALPICGLHLDDRYAHLSDFTGRLAIATNWNPGSAPSCSMPLAISLAVRKCGLTPDQAVLAATASPADLLGLHDRGRIDVGLPADLIILDTDDHRDLAFSLGRQPGHTHDQRWRLAQPRPFFNPVANLNSKHAEKKRVNGFEPSTFTLAIALGSTTPSQRSFRSSRIGRSKDP